jgi:hypothetical protein
MISSPLGWLGSADCNTPARRPQGGGMRHHGGVATTTCIHGFSPDQCLICQTLQSGKDQSRRRPAPAAGAPQPARVRPDAVLREPAAPHRSLALRAGFVVLMIAVVVLLAGWIAGLAFTILRLIELGAVALVAGWIGYRIGLFRGRRLGDDR